MNDIQINIGDIILKEFAANDGRLSDNRYMTIITNEIKGVNNDLIYTTIGILIEDYGLIRRNISDKSLKIITADGYKAAKIGLRQFIIQFDDQKELEKENLKANIKTAKLAEKNSKYSLTISILALIVSALIPFLSTRCDDKSRQQNTQNNPSENCKEKIKNSVALFDINMTDSINISK